MGHDFGSGSFVEKTCSRCQQYSWDSVSGSYDNVCTVDGKKCDTNGRKYVDGKPQ